MTTCKEIETKRVLEGLGWMALGAGIGAGAMFLFDPNRGKARRAMLRDRGAHLLREEEKRVRQTFADVGNRLKGAESELMHLFVKDDACDAKVEGRVRSKLGRAVETPHDVQVLVHEGAVTLRGKTRPDEMEKVVPAVRGVRGVKTVVNQMMGAPVC